MSTYEEAATSGLLLELERREDAEGPGPLLWDANPDVCCAAYQLGACDHTEAFSSEDYADQEAAWRRDFPAEAAAADEAHEAFLVAQAAREAAQDAAWGVEPF